MHTQNKLCTRCGLIAKKLSQANNERKVGTYMKNKNTFKNTLKIYLYGVFREVFLVSHTDTMH